MRRRSVGLALCVALGCGDDDAAVTGDSTGTATTDSESSQSSDPSVTTSMQDTSGSSDTGESSGSSTTGEPSMCGDGERQGLEQCDDGNDTPDDGCEPGCLLPSGGSVWTVTVDGGDDDVAADVALAGDGSIVVVGSRGDDAWIGAYGPDGVELSSMALDLGEGDRDALAGVALREGGMVVVGTATAGSGDMANPDALIVALDDTLATVWQDRVDGGLDDGAQELSIAGADIVVVGSSETMATRADAWIRRYDADGAEVWTQTEDGSANATDLASAVAWTPGGGMIVVGKLRGADDDLWISARDGDGVEQWNELLDFDFGDDYGAGVVLAGDEIWVTGSISSALTNSEEVWIASYGADGTQSWSTSWNSNGFVFESGEDLVVDGTDVWVAGITAAPDQQRNVLAGRWQQGTVDALWTDGTDGGPGLGDLGHAIARLDDGSVVVVGELTVLGQGTDAWIRRYAP